MNERISEEAGQSAVRFLDGVLQAARLDMRVQNEQPGDEGLLLELQGSDTGLVLGNNARVLYALEHLVNQVIHHASGGQLKITLDCNGYRSTRVLELQLMARKAAEKVRTTGVSFSLQPMPAVERRVIHLTLAEEAGIRTESSGLGLNRHVVIFPGR
ncbi:MAG: protein jag [Acidobacteriota bacterium]